MDSQGKKAPKTTDVKLLPALVVSLSLSVGLAGCRGSPPLAPVGVSGAPTLNVAIAFHYDSLDERQVSSDALRGRPTVIAFVTTWDLMSQAQVDFLVAMAKNDVDRVNYALVALQEVKDRELVEVYRSKLGVTFRVALGDKETIAGGGPFGDVHNVPTIVVLDRDGRVAWQRVGLAKSEDLRAALRGL